MADHEGAGRKGEGRREREIGFPLVIVSSSLLSHCGAKRGNSSSSLKKDEERQERPRPSKEREELEGNSARNSFLLPDALKFKSSPISANEAVKA
jgi:hypothetical protein